MPPPPPGVDTTLPAIIAEKPMTNRERLDHARQQSELRQLPPLDRPDWVAALKASTTIGRFRDKMSLRIRSSTAMRSHTSHVRRKNLNLTWTPTGYIQGIANSEFSTAAELGKILADEPHLPKMRREADLPLRDRPARDTRLTSGRSTRCTTRSVLPVSVSVN